MTNVEYPKLSMKQKRSAKLTDSDLEKIKKLHDSGMTVYSICKMFDVAYATIKYHCDPKYKKYLREKTVGYQKDKLKDPVAYRKHLDSDNALKREKYNNDPEFRKYRRCVENRWKKKNPERWKELQNRANKNRK